MKYILYACFSILFFFLMLFFPKETLAGATSGLLLWFQILLPTLLPFFIFTSFIVETNAIHYVSYVCGPIFQRLFCLSSNGSFAALCGMLCGYPVGAKVTADLVRTNQISHQEGMYLLSFCNNTSPAFIITFIVFQNFCDQTLVIPTIFILYASPIICSFFFRKYYRMKYSPCTSRLKNSFLNFKFSIMDNCIMKSFENITKVGGYVILFSILFSFGENLPITYFLPLLEITNGIPYIIKTFSSFELTYIFTLFLTSFGGICSIAQTSSMLIDTNLSIFSYTIEKLITALVTSLLAFLYIFIILR